MKTKLLLLTFFFSSMISAQTKISDTTDIFELELRDLMNIEVTIASRKATTLRESPGIVLVITADEIRKSGARDLIDLLNSTPGFGFAADVQGVVGIGIRGLWAHEGKVLLMLDGVSLNEKQYNCTEFGSHFQLSQIKRIELIRGPGSAIYGGNAELGVINIITKEAGDINGFSLAANYGQMQKDFARRTLALSFGHTFKNNLQFAAHASGGQANRSDKDFTDFYGKTYSMADGNSTIKPMNFNASLKNKNLNIRLIADFYNLKQRDMFGSNVPSVYEPISTDFSTFVADVSYTFNLSEKFKLTPRFFHTRENTWKAEESDLQEYYNDPNSINYFPEAQFVNDVEVNSYNSALIFSYQPITDIYINGGAEMTFDKAEAFNSNFNFVNDNKEPTKTVNYNNFSPFVQAIFNTKYANFTGGFRFENHSAVGSTFVPRFGITRVFNKLHLKFLYANSFRAPSIMNIHFNKDIKPEKTTVYEIEAGYEFTPEVFFTANAFDITVSDAIIYRSDETLGDTYSNYAQTGSRGFELELKIKKAHHYAYFSYSFYSPADKNEVGIYQVPDNKNLLLAFAAHKFSLNYNWQFKKLTVSPSFVFLSERYAYTHYDANQEPVIEKFNPTPLLNIYFLISNLGTKNLNLGFGVYDIFDKNYRFMQAYSGGHAPIPANGREVLARLTYSFSIK